MSAVAENSEMTISGTNDLRLTLSASLEPSEDRDTPMAALLALDLPDLGSLEPAEIADDGSAVYVSESATDVAVQAFDGGARIVTVLSDSSAPDNYEYTAVGTVPELNSDGSVTLLSRGAGFVVEVARLDTPWAYDSDGDAVDTHFEVVGDKITQVLDLNDKTIAYPVTADPKVQVTCWYLGCKIRFDRATTRNIRDGVNISGILGGAGGALVAATGAATIGAAVAVVAAVLLTMGAIAGRFYENGNCLAIHYAGVWFPTQTKRNTYNCR